MEPLALTFEPLSIPRLGRTLSWRRMRPQDLESVHTLEVRLFSSPWSKLAFFEEMAAHNPSLCIVILDKKDIVGYLIIHYIVDEIHIANIAIAPEYQRLGIGLTVLEKILNSATRNGFVVAHLEVRKNNAGAISLYEKMGFVVVGLRKNYYQQEKEDALLMSCDLPKRRATIHNQL